MIKKLFNIGLGKSLENVAKEWIKKDTNKLKAQSVIIKALDPNGIMRRQLSIVVCRLYSIYIILALLLIILQAFNIGPIVAVDDTEVKAVSIALKNVIKLFTPISTAFGVIITASFGVNLTNSMKQ